jgi:sporulation protein YlmC with PRC-barrel domain
MQAKQVAVQTNNSTKLPDQKLMVSGTIHLEQIDSTPIEVQRGMIILTREGVEAGRVAAMVIDCRSEEVTHVLLGHVPPTSDYRLVSLNLIDRVDRDVIQLRVTSEDIEKLPVHQPD